MHEIAEKFWLVVLRIWRLQAIFTYQICSQDLVFVYTRSHTDICHSGILLLPRY